MALLFNNSRRGVVAGVVACAPLVLASSCSEPSSSFFDPPMGSGMGGGMTAGSGGSSAGTTSSGGTAGKSGTGGNAGNGATTANGGTGTGGTDATGGTPGGGSGGDLPLAGTGGMEPEAGGTAAMDAMGGEGGMPEGGMGGTLAGTAGTSGSAGTTSDGGTAGAGAAAGTGGLGGSAGDAGTGGGGTSGSAGANSGGTGGMPCTPDTEICDGLDNDCGKDIDEGNVCPDGCLGATFQGRSFLLCHSNGNLEWTEARTECMDADSGSGNVEVAGPMTLVEIGSAEENAFLVEWIKTENVDDHVWMGANDRTTEGQWVWDRGADNASRFYNVTMAGMRMPVNGAYHDWPTGQPTYGGTDCGRFDAEDSFHWNDGACTQAPLNWYLCGEIP